MTEYRVSSRADNDLSDIFEFSVERFGLVQAKRYLEEFRTCFYVLAENPQLGRKAESIGPGVRRHEHKSHVILYEIGARGITVLAVMHGRRSIPARYRDNL